MYHVTLVRRAAPVLLATAMAMSAGCSSSDSTNNTSGGGCPSTINSASAASPSANQLVVPGLFYTSDAVVVGYTLLGHATTVQGGPAVNGATSITFLGLPSGTQTFTFQVICTGPAPAYAALHSDFPSASITIK